MSSLFQFLFSFLFCLSVPPCLFLSTTLPKHALITDLCSWYSHPLARKRSGSVIALIQAMFIYVITAASTVKLSLSFLPSQKSPYSVERDWERDVCQFAWERNGSSRKTPHSPFNILFEALEIDERYVIDFASWGLLFLCADNYERISQSKQQSAWFLLGG